MRQRLRLREARRQAGSFEKVREAHQTELAEDYVELIADLISAEGARGRPRQAPRGDARDRQQSGAASDARRPGREPPVSRHFLTPEGRALADRVRARHSLVRDFLIALGVDRETAESDAEGIEHHVSPKTLAAFRRFLERD